LDRLWNMGVRLATDGVAKGAVTSLAIKVSGSALAIVMFTLAARFMGPERFGHFAVLFNLMSFLAVVSVLGQDTLIVRSWTEYVATGEHGLARGAYRFGWVTAIISSLCVIVFLVIAAFFNLVVVDGVTLLACAFFLLCQTMLHFSSHSSRTIAGFLISETTRELVWRILVILAMLIGFASGYEIMAWMLFFSSGIGMLAGVAIQSRRVAQVFPDEVRMALPQSQRGQWFRRVAGMWPSAILEAASQYIDVILIGLLVTPTSAGGYFVAARIANVFSMISSGTMSYVSPRIGTLFFSGRHAELQQLFNKLMIIIGTMIVLLCSLIVFFGHQILQIFGASYASEYMTLLVLAIGAGIANLTGPTGAVLLTTGHELTYSRFSFYGLATRLVLFFIFVPVYGSLGAAIAWTLATVPVAVALVLMSRRELGLDPSVFGLLRASRH